MTFLAPFLFVLAGFASVPILLHLIRRRRVRVLEIPTFRFIQKAAMAQRIHLRLQDQLLMALRILILLLLALAFAGPTTRVDYSGNLPLLGPENLLVLDDSFSMSARSGDLPSPFDRARSAVQMLLAAAPEGWKVLFASDVSAASDPLPAALQTPETFAEAAESHAGPTFRGRMEDVLAKLANLRSQGTRLWLVTDRSASNWRRSLGTAGDGEGPTADPVEVLTIDTPPYPPNWSLRSLELDNRPLLAGEPALLSIRYGAEDLAATGPAPDSVAVSWKNARGEWERLEETIPPGDGKEGSVRTSIAGEEVESISASLRFAADSADPLPADDRLAAWPQSLGNVRVGLIAPTVEWGEILAAALSGFEVERFVTARPAPEGPSPPNSYILLLGRETPGQAFVAYLRAKVEGGCGLLVLYDDEPDGIRREAWAEWWREWDILPNPHSMEGLEGAAFVSGGDDWFGTALDPTAKTDEWLVEPLSLIEHFGMSSEWLLDTEDASQVPLFQTESWGEGLVAVWTVPVSPKVSPLLTSPAWVPLFSQTVKRTLIDTASMRSTGEEEVRVAESDLTPLSEVEKGALSRCGYRISSAENVVDTVENLPRSRHDWTSLCLALCLALGLIEVFVSNRT